MRTWMWVITREQLNRWSAVGLLAAVIVMAYAFSRVVPPAPSPLVQQTAASARQPLTHLAPVFEAPAAKGMMALAINIDWGEEYLPAMLDVLAESGVKATFFPTGTWAEKFPDLVRQIAAAGHELGNHGASHAHPKQLSDASLTQLIQQGAAIVEALSGQKPRLFAPPFGEFDQRIVRIAAESGYYTTLWTLDTIDWQKPSPALILQRILPRARDGAIVLMHPTAPTLEALPQLIQALQKKGYRLVTVSQLIEAHQRAVAAQKPTEL